MAQPFSSVVPVARNAGSDSIAVRAVFRVAWVQWSTIARLWCPVIAAMSLDSSPASPSHVAHVGLNEWKRSGSSSS